MPPTFKKHPYLVLPSVKPCLQLLPALPNHPRLGGNFLQGGLQPLVKFLGKISALSKNGDKGK